MWNCPLRFSWILVVSISSRQVSTNQSKSAWNLLANGCTSLVRRGRSPIPNTQTPWTKWPWNKITKGKVEFHSRFWWSPGNWEYTLESKQKYQLMTTQHCFSHGVCFLVDGSIKPNVTSSAHIVTQRQPILDVSMTHSLLVGDFKEVPLPHMLHHRHTGIRRDHCWNPASILFSSNPASSVTFQQHSTKQRFLPSPCLHWIYCK